MRRLPWEAGPLELWRLDASEHAPAWDSGKGAEMAGGRWNPEGYAVVYGSADPATAILEVAVHKGFRALDRVRHVVTRARLDAGDVHVLAPPDIPNPLWLTPAPPSRDQQEFGRSLLEAHAFLLVPSAVCNWSWNLMFNPVRAAGRYRLDGQQPFALDTRLNPP